MVGVGKNLWCGLSCIFCLGLGRSMDYRLSEYEYRCRLNRRQLLYRDDHADRKNPGRLYYSVPFSLKFLFDFLGIFSYFINKFTCATG